MPIFVTENLRTVVTISVRTIVTTSVRTVITVNLRTVVTISGRTIVTTSVRTVITTSVRTVIAVNLRTVVTISVRTIVTTSLHSTNTPRIAVLGNALGCSRYYADAQRAIHSAVWSKCRLDMCNLNSQYNNRNILILKKENLFGEIYFYGIHNVAFSCGTNFCRIQEPTTILVNFFLIQAFICNFNILILATL